MANKNPDEMEKAEGSRGTVNANLDPDDSARERYDEQEAERGQGEGKGKGGITNRPLSREVEEQGQLPPRGEAKDPEKDHA